MRFLILVLCFAGQLVFAADDVSYIPVDAEQMRCVKGQYYQFVNYEFNGEVVYTYKSVFGFAAASTLVACGRAVMAARFNGRPVMVDFVGGFIQPALQKGDVSNGFVVDPSRIGCKGMLFDRDLITLDGLPIAFSTDDCVTRIGAAKSIGSKIRLDYASPANVNLVPVYRQFTESKF